MSAPRRQRQQQRGVALITAVLIVALATILAVDVGFNGYLEQRRSATAFALDQGFEVALGGEAWAADALRLDMLQSPKTDDFTEAWAQPIPPIPIEGGEFEGQLEDMQGRFNINSLVMFEGGRFKTDLLALDRFQQLLRLVGLEDKWAGYIADWLDSDVDPNFPGAEDPTYTGLAPPYRTANMPVTRTSELLALPDFGIERYQKLEPFIAALPIGTKVNLCTASPALLDALIGEQEEFTRMGDTVPQTRKERCFPTQQEFEASLSAKRKQELQNTYDVKSSYFRSTVWVTIGTTQYTLYSLLYRAGGGGGGQKLVRPILRSHGTP
jgi:general secretion pathway protein K